MRLPKLLKLKKTSEQSHTAVYDLTYKNRMDDEKIYTIMSRNKELTTETLAEKTDAVIMLVLSSDLKKALLLKEFRMGLNKVIINSPAGLIDPGEDIVAAATRELKEETGYEVKSILHALNPGYSSAGITDEKVAVVICTADESIINTQELSTDETIDYDWYTVDQMITLHESYDFDIRTELLCQVWKLMMLQKK